MVFVEVSESTHAALMLDPGAWMSTQVPQLEKLDFASIEVVDPTVIASTAEAGEL